MTWTKNNGGVSAGGAFSAIPHGSLDFASRGLISGWAFDPEFPEKQIAVEVLANGEIIGRIIADGYRADLERAGIGDGRHSFELLLEAETLAPGLRYEITARRRSDGALLLNSPIVLEPDPADSGLDPADRDTFSREPSVEAPLEATIGLGRLVGKLEIASRNSISGWARNELDAHLPVGLEVSIDGEVIARVLANRYRVDLQNAGIGDGEHGFELIFPELSPIVPHDVRVVREADGAELAGSPRIVPAANLFDAEAEKGIESILSGLDPRSESRALEFLTRQAERLLAARAARESDREARHWRYIFRRRWGKLIGGDPALSSLGDVNPPRALVIDDEAPDLARDTGSHAILSHIRALKALGFAVSFVAAEEMEHETTASALEAEAGVALCGSPYYYSVEDVLKRQAGLFDVVYLHRISNARKYLALARAHQPKAWLVYSVAELHHIRLARQGEIEGVGGVKRLSEQIAFDEFTAGRQADAVITHSPLEAEILRRRVSPAKVHVVPWSVSPRPCATSFAARHGLALIGRFAHKPNPDAVVWLLRHVMPLVWEKNPSMSCLVVGDGWSESRLPRHDSRVEVIGPIPDLQTVFDRVRLTAAPLRFGSGVTGQVLQSFAAGIPCVMSPIAAEGLDLPSPLMELVAVGARAMADAILRFHSDGLANAAAAEAGLEFVAREASQRRVREAMARALPAFSPTALSGSLGEMTPSPKRDAGEAA